MTGAPCPGALLPHDGTHIRERACVAPVMSFALGERAAWLRGVYVTPDGGMFTRLRSNVRDP